MALFVKRAEDGRYPCPDDGCDKTYATGSSLRRHCQDHAFEVTTVMPQTEEEKKRKKRDAMRSARASKAAKRNAHASPGRSLYSSLDADERGAYGADDSWVEYRPSRIEGAGNGVFARESFQPGDIITRCSGQAANTMSDDTRYTIKMRSRSGVKFLNGLRVPVQGEGLGTFVNRESRRHPRSRKNCILLQEGNAMYVQADAPIHPGEELLTTYGKGYRTRRTAHNVNV